MSAWSPEIALFDAELALCGRRGQSDLAADDPVPDTAGGGDVVLLDGVGAVDVGDVDVVTDRALGIRVASA
ncbi:hypothetical protein [Gordonia rhizosphera]|uniref:Uncharacterized protein n=1 Tax=Gordonia rhizosphera NBRC 16068 TaxID=1108045 RepID=K6V3X3_9ACTN|nr:hypothetical protein [Gordonia rhizosphera]GAB90783.1 hypothetical protein GORHZ_117_00470 [Gordonia rhizosphera NBRC 16068]